MERFSDYGLCPSSSPSPSFEQSDQWGFGGFDTLKSLGAVFYDQCRPIEAQISRRPSDGLCGYYCLANSNSLRVAKLRQKKIATWIREHPEFVIGSASVLQHIKNDVGESVTSESYYNHHMGIKPFPLTGHRENQWIGPLKLIVDCLIH